MSWVSISGVIALGLFVYLVLALVNRSGSDEHL